MRRIAVMTSGGDAPGMNATIRAVVRKAIYHQVEVYGIHRGFAGLVNGDAFCRLESGSVADIIHRGGTMLLTARAPEFKEPAVQDKALLHLQEAGIEGLVVIGGDGSFRGAVALQRKGFKTIGIPGTIDNDIAGSDSSIGFDTAVNTVLDAINRLRDTATSHERIFVIEVMGRTTGFIALAAGLAGGAESILVPEIDYDLDDICRRLTRGIQRGKLHSIILVAEGAASAFYIGGEIKNRLGLETRVTVLGHLQRGGTPTAADRILASRMGAAAVDFLREGKSGLMVAYQAGDITPVPLEKVLSAGKSFPVNLYQLTRVLST